MKKSMITRMAATGIAALLLGLGAGTGAASAASAASVAVPAGLDAGERAALLHMVEEEKLAYDVYVTLGKVWNVRTFANISASEARHTAAMRALLSTYGLADPTKGRAVGAFTDPALAALYGKLVAAGKSSLASALQAGVTIEELDIDDLEVRIAQTDQADIAATFQNLLRGSNNHLAAFSRALARS